MRTLRWIPEVLTMVSTVLSFELITEYHVANRVFTGGKHTPTGKKPKIPFFSPLRTL